MQNKRKYRFQSIIGDKGFPIYGMTFFSSGGAAGPHLQKNPRGTGFSHGFSTQILFHSLILLKNRLARL